MIFFRKLFVSDKLQKTLDENQKCKQELLQEKFMNQKLTEEIDKTRKEFIRIMAENERVKGVIYFLSNFCHFGAKVSHTYAFLI